ncbi:MAG: hypothetical protein ABJB16_15460 [Saprospiraceae bacterium]
MRFFLLIILGLLDIGCLIAMISLWRSSHYPGAEIGNMDGSLAKICAGLFLGITLVIFGIFYFKK